MREARDHLDLRTNVCYYSFSENYNQDAPDIGCRFCEISFLKSAAKIERDTGGGPKARISIMKMQQSSQVWTSWYAWFPVMPRDGGLFWLECVWRRKMPNGRWEYRSFRSDLEKEQEAARREI